jgi:hypothetical protein
MKLVSSPDDDLAIAEIAARQIENARDRVGWDLEKSPTCIVQFVRWMGTKRTDFFGTPRRLPQILSVDRI